MSKQNSFPKEKIMDLEVDNLTMSQALAEITSIIKRKKSCYIVKPYVEFFDPKKRTKATDKIIRDAYLCLPDGVSLNWAAFYRRNTKHRLVDVFTSAAKIVLSPEQLHLALPNHSWGTNFTIKLLKQAASNSHSVFLVGSPKDSSIEKTKAFLKRKLPNLKIVGIFSGRDARVGYFTDAMLVSLSKQIKSAGPDIILVGLGYPLQEKVIAKLASTNSHGVFIGEGGTFDFKSFGGKLPKAPRWMQNIGIEWLWRLAIEPSRFRRQLAIPKFMAQVYRYYKKQ